MDAGRLSVGYGMKWQPLGAGIYRPRNRWTAPVVRGRPAAELVKNAGYQMGASLLQVSRCVTQGGGLASLTSSALSLPGDQREYSRSVLSTAPSS